MKQHCKECKELKEISEYYKHPQGQNWVLSRCKECVKRWRRSEKERKMARVNDNKRSKTPHRLKQLTKQCKQYRKENPKKYKAHWLVNNYYRYHKDERPYQCSHCNGWWQIEMHHEDYNKPREIIPLCSLCHKGYHKWSIEIDKTKMITISPPG